MRFVRSAVITSLCACAATLCLAAISSDSPARKELKRADLAGAPDMEVISSVSEYKTGETVPRHFHHGVEAAYVLQGTMVQYPGQAPTALQTGTAVLNPRDVPHAGFTVVGDQPLKLFSVHVVDKGKPLYEWVK